MYKEQGYNCYLQVPKNKDFNEDLIQKIADINNQSVEMEDEFER